MGNNDERIIDVFKMLVGWGNYMTGTEKLHDPVPIYCKWYPYSGQHSYTLMIIQQAPYKNVEIRTYFQVYNG